jgi:hypothetical protein
MTGARHHDPFGPKMISWSMPASEEFDARPVRAFVPGPGVQVDETVWPASVPAVAQLLREGLELPVGLTVLVGENLGLVVAWRHFMRDPQSYFRHLFAEL